MDLKPWKILDTQTAFKNRFWNIVQETVELPDGSVYDQYFVNHTKGAVVIFSVTEEGKVLVNRQYKHGVREVIQELTVGTVEEQEVDRLETAKRELLEETGYGHGEWEALPIVMQNATNSTARLYPYLARGVRKLIEPEKNPREIVEVIEMDPSDFVQCCFAGELSTISATSVAFLALVRLGWIAKSA